MRTIIGNALLGLSLLILCATSSVGAQPIPNDVHSLLKEMGRGTGGREAQMRLRLKHRGSAIVPELISALHDPDEIVRQNALHVITELGPLAKAAVPTLIELIGTEGWDSAFAKTSLITMRFEAIDGLLQALGSSNKITRRNAAEILGLIHSRPDECLPLLRHVGADPDPVVRAEALKAIGNFQNLGQDSIDALVQGLDDLSPGVRASAAFALAEQRPKDKNVVAALTKALSDDDAAVASRAAQALSAIKDPASRAAANKYYRRLSVLRTFGDLPYVVTYVGFGRTGKVLFFLIQIFSFYRLFVYRKRDRLSLANVSALGLGALCDLTVICYQWLIVGWSLHSPSIAILAAGLVSIGTKFGLFGLHMGSVSRTIFKAGAEPN